jgi:hypothetical protein
MEPLYDTEDDNSENECKVTNTFPPSPIIVQNIDTMNINEINENNVIDELQNVVKTMAECPDVYHTELCQLYDKIGKLIDKQKDINDQCNNVLTNTNTHKNIKYNNTADDEDECYSESIEEWETKFVYNKNKPIVSLKNIIYRMIQWFGVYVTIISMIHFIDVGDSKNTIQSIIQYHTKDTFFDQYNTSHLLL